MKIEFILNNKKVNIDIDPTMKLLDVIRDTFNLKGTKRGCEQGACGACAVIIDGKLANSCNVPICTVKGRRVMTIEGYKITKRFKVIEKAFEKAGSFQCGFCTPGMVMATEALLSRNPNPTEEEIREGISGNLCRCTGYNMIVEGVKLAAKMGSGLW